MKINDKWEVENNHGNLVVFRHGKNTITLQHTDNLHLAMFQKIEEMQSKLDKHETNWKLMKEIQDMKKELRQIDHELDA